MKKTKTILVAAIALIGFSIVSANALVLDFANLTNTDINFLGNGTMSGNGQFDFTSDSAGYQFIITSPGVSDGLEGYITNSDLFTIGSITGSPPIQTAPVSGTGVMNITDRSGINLTGTLQWENISTFNAIGGLNITGELNLVNIQYTGTNADLAVLASAGQADDVLSFQFASPMSLSMLDVMATNTSFSGSIESVPEPGNLPLTGVAVVVVGLLSFRGATWAKARGKRSSA